MRWDINKQIATIIIVFIVMFYLMIIALTVFNGELTITYNINMDNNTLEAVKSIDWGVMS